LTSSRWYCELGPPCREQEFCGECVNVPHGKIHPGGICDCKQMKHSIGGASHCYIERHGIQKSLPCGDRSRQH
jgi:hypothetical protein